jgi:predicted nucleic acid-binding Zn ribbon protein
MPTYIYETTDAAKPVRNFEVKQSLHDDPLTADPVTGEPARRITPIGYSNLVRRESIVGTVESVE